MNAITGQWCDAANSFQRSRALSRSCSFRHQRQPHRTYGRPRNEHNCNEIITCDNQNNKQIHSTHIHFFCSALDQLELRPIFRLLRLCLWCCRRCHFFPRSVLACLFMCFTQTQPREADSVGATIRNAWKYCEFASHLKIMMRYITFGHRESVE